MPPRSLTYWLCSAEAVLAGFFTKLDSDRPASNKSRSILWWCPKDSSLVVWVIIEWQSNWQVINAWSEMKSPTQSSVINFDSDGAIIISRIWPCSCVGLFTNWRRLQACNRLRNLELSGLWVSKWILKSPQIRKLLLSDVRKPTKSVKSSKKAEEQAPRWPVYTRNYCGYCIGFSRDHNRFERLVSRWLKSI